MERILTGDRPTGPLHLGHYVGSIENRIELQNKYECFFIIADLQVLTDHLEESPQIEENIYELMADYLALGLKPSNCFFVQSCVPELVELTNLFTYFVSVSRVNRNPTVKTEAKVYGVSQISVGFQNYPISQSADILGFKPSVIPVGKDQLPHIELTREIAKSFNTKFKEKLFEMPRALLSETPSLIGTDGKNKMSKSLGNAIFFKDPKEVVRKKIMTMYTDPNRLHPTDPGDPDKNPVFIYHRIFNPNRDEVLDLENRYKSGSVGDVEVKEKLFIAISNFIDPIRDRREEFIKDKSIINDILIIGNARAREVVKDTLNDVKKAVSLNYEFSD
jgi:tryptophanyl-tRNA synthetase